MSTPLPPIMERLRCRLPEMATDDGRVRIVRRMPTDFELMRAAFAEGRPGVKEEFAALFIGEQLWMSDTAAERRDHYTPVRVADRYPGGDGLVNGLGLACITCAWLDTLGHVDVVERDGQLIDLVGPWLKEQYGDRVTIHHGDAYTVQWDVGRRWDVAWHDIWPTISSDNLEGMSKLHRRYGRRTRWQASWCRLEAMRGRYT